MRVRSRLAVVFVAAVLIALLQPSLSAKPVRVYQVHDLGFVAAGTYLVGNAINANGEVAGWAVGADGRSRAFRWTPTGGLDDLGASAWQGSEATTINDNGDVAGEYWDQDGGQHPFIARRGQPVVDLTALYPEILAIFSMNNAGQLTGYTRSGNAFKTEPGGALRELSTSSALGASINEAGEVAGYWWPLPKTAFRYSDAAGLVDLGTLDGGGSVAWAINEAGVIAGASGITGIPAAHAFRAKPGLPLEDLGVLQGGVPGGTSVAYAINDRGSIVGQADNRSGYTAFLHTDAHGMIDLRDRITVAERAAFPIDSATSINNAGQILAGYNSPFGEGAYGTVLLTPVWREFDGPIAAPTAEPSSLRPADNRMVSVSVDPHATDEYDPEPACRIVSVVNSQWRSGPDRDVEITGPLTVDLRASRRGAGESRAYTITVGCTDSFGLTASSDVVVAVPHAHGPHD
jgi:probable HAF family extracellular repeat protein